MITKKKTKIEEKDFKDDVKKDDLKPLPLFHPLSNVSKSSFSYWKQKFYEKYRPSSVVLINFETSAGFHTSFLVKTKEGGFRYNKATYILDEELKYYVISAKLWAYDFHQEFSIPIKRRIPLNEIKKAVENSNITQVEHATNPLTLDRFITSKIAEGIMKGQALDSWMRFVKLLIIIILVITGIHFLLFLNASGMLNDLNLPF